MAGGIRKDPAIERWAMMRDNTHLYFRMTPMTLGFGLIALVGIPLALYYGIEKGNVRLKLCTLTSIGGEHEIFSQGRALSSIISRYKFHLYL
jgi:hypothetical protein